MSETLVAICYHGDLEAVKGYLSPTRNGRMMLLENGIKTDIQGTPKTEGKIQAQSSLLRSCELEFKFHLQQYIISVAHKKPCHLCSVKYKSLTTRFYFRQLDS